MTRAMITYLGLGLAHRRRGGRPPRRTARPRRRRRSGWRSVLWAAPIAAVFIFVFGPAAYAVLSALGLAGFEAGLGALGALPRWYLALAVVVVAAGEEWLYRGYAIERLERLTRRGWLAGARSLAAFVLAHLPVWGPGPALATLVSGGLLTALYLWRRDVLALMLAHAAVDLWGIVLSPP